MGKPNITLQAGGVVQLDALQTNNSQVQDKQVLTGVSVDAETNTQTAKLTANLMQNVTNNMASAVVSSAINGTPLNEDTVGTALSSALITAGTAQAANSIGAAATGTNPTLNAYTQAMAHALAGCLGGAATTGNSGGCSAGAVGAVVGELSATYALGQGMSDAATVNFAKTMSAVAGALVGGPDSAAAVNVAAQMGANAAANNRLLHKNEKQVISQMANGDSAKQDRLTDAACAMVKCSAQYAPSTPEYLDAKASEIRGANNTQELTELAKVNQATGLFGYSGMDNANDMFKFTGNVVNKEIVQPVKEASSPDYLTIQAGGAGGASSLSVNLHNGDTFLGVSKTNISSGPSGSVVLGKMVTVIPTGQAKEDAVSEMLSGGSLQGGLCVAGLCGGVNQSIGVPGSNPPTSVEFGVGTPGASVGTGASVNVYKSKKTSED